MRRAFKTKEEDEHPLQRGEERLDNQQRQDADSDMKEDFMQCDMEQSPPVLQCTVLNNNDPDDDWFVAPFSKLHVSSRKRKLCETSPGHSRSLITRDIAVSKKSVRLSPEARKLMKLYRDVFGNDDHNISENILEYLPDSDLGRLCLVNSKFRGLCYNIRRQRTRNTPFVLCWRTEEALTTEDFSCRIQSHFDPTWINGSLAGPVVPIMNIISFGTSYLNLTLSDFDAVDPISQGHISFSFASSSQIAVTLPKSHGKSGVLKTTSNPTFALQSLFIPFNYYVNFLNIAIPISNETNRSCILGELQRLYFPKRDQMVSTKKFLKFVLGFQYCENDLLLNQFADSVVNGCGTPTDEVGIIVAVVDEMFSNQIPEFFLGRTVLSTLLVLHGYPMVQVAILGLNVTVQTLKCIQSMSASFFGSTNNAIIFMIYRSYVTNESLAVLKNSLGNIPLMGISTGFPIAFQGIYVNDLAMTLNERTFLQNSVELDVGVALAFIKY